MATAKNAAVLINYLAVAREGGGILGSYSRIDDPLEITEYSGNLRQLIEDKEMVEKMKAHTGSRFHRVLDLESKTTLHMHWMAEFVDEKQSTIVVYFAVVTDTFASQAPQSASALLVHLRDNMTAKYNDKLLNGKEGSLTKPAEKLLEALAFTYGLSKIAQVDAAIEKVKETMRNNIEVALENVERLEKMEADAAALEEEANKWKWKAKKKSKRFFAGKNGRQL